MYKPIQNIMQEFLIDQGRKLIYVKEYGAFYLQNEQYGYYESLFKNKEDVFRYLHRWLCMSVNSNLTKGTYENALLLLKNMCIQVEEFNSSQVIFNDHKVLNLGTLEITDHDPNDFIFYFLDCPSPKGESHCPVFKNFLSEVLVKEIGESKFEPDLELIEFVKVMFGYYLIDKIEPPTTFFLVGDGSNGKSTLLNVLQQLAGGDKFVMSNSVENLTTKQFDAAQLRFNRLNVCTEEQSKYLRSDRFKTIVEGSRIHADIKFSDPVSFCPKTKHVFATNRLPLFDTIDYGLKRRLKIVPFKRKFMPHETNKTYKTLKFKKSVFYPELSGIIKWAIEGANYLVNNNYTFPKCAAVEKELSVYENNVSSVAMFINDNFTGINEEASRFISDFRLYRLYSEWCKNNNKKAFAVNNFNEELRHLRILSVVGRDDFSKHISSRGRRMSIAENSELKSSYYSSNLNDSELIPEF